MLFDPNLPLTCFLSSLSAYHSPVFPTSGLPVHSLHRAAHLCFGMAGLLLHPAAHPSPVHSRISATDRRFAFAPFENQCCFVRFLFSNRASLPLLLLSMPNVWRPPLVRARALPAASCHWALPNVAVSAPPRCLKHPPAAAATTVVRFQTAAYLFLVIFCLLTLVHFSTSGKLSPLTRLIAQLIFVSIVGFTPASKRHFPQLFRILLLSRVAMQCAGAPLPTPSHHALRPCSSSGHGMRQLLSCVTLEGEGRRRGLLGACSTQRLQLRDQHLPCSLRCEHAAWHAEWLAQHTIANIATLFFT